jgi:hypothetical protein
MAARYFVSPCHWSGLSRWAHEYPRDLLRVFADGFSFTAMQCHLCGTCRARVALSQPGPVFVAAVMFIVLSFLL